MRETGQRLARRFAGADADSMNLVVLDGSELDADPSRLAVEAKTTSLFGDRRVIRVRGAGKSLVMTLTELRDDPGAAIILEAGNLAPRDPLRALVEAAKLGRALPCYPDSDESLIRLIADSFNKAGIRADQDAVAALRDSLGNDREVTRRELEKLELYAQDSKSPDARGYLAALRRQQRAGDRRNHRRRSHRPRGGNGCSAGACHRPERQRAADFSEPSQPLRHLAPLAHAVDAGQSPGGVLDSSRPKPHFSRRSSLERQLRLWTDEALAAALERLQLAVADSRKRYALQEVVGHRALLAICSMAAER